MTPPPQYSGWALPPDVRTALLAALRHADVPPAHPVVVCDHVTHAYPDTAPAFWVGEVAVTGHVADDRVQVLTVTVDGATVRPDGRTYHLTYSHRPGIHPADSNRLLASGAGVAPLPAPFWVPAVPFLRDDR